MASSSSSSHSVPASVSLLWNYEVFLSFRGEDTRKGFVGHLYKALEQQGIYTYKDDETLDRGESIGPALLKAIKESRIAVIVFSKNYADSSWCLDELVHIMDCMENKGQIVMPVFYEVDPSDVRKQNEKYGEAFEKHERENKEKVELWRKALVKAGNLSGWVLRDFAYGHEAKCIEDIVGTIFGRLSQLNTSVAKDFIGIETRLRDLKLKLKIGSGGVKMVGIWGVGGGGKTTLASAAYMEISHQFDAHCLLENIRDESSKHGLKKLQEKVLSLILKTKVELGSEIEGREMIKSRLRRKRVLIVLDDVDDKKQLEALAGSDDWFGDGSRIIITTRDQHLLPCKEDAIYEVSLLSNDEAIKLFNRHAKPENKPIEDYEKLSLEVVTYAGGLPLALEILGSFLCDKDNYVWKSVLARLKSIPDHQDVMERLKISYDGLKHEQQSLFLDIACFFRRWNKDEAMIVLHACSSEPLVGVKVLVQKSLIKISEYGRLDMHDLVEEMAHYIVRGEHPNDPEKHSRIWQEKDIVELCVMGPEMLMGNNHIEVLALPSRITELVDPFSSLPNYVSDPRLPDVVAKMKKLRLIFWEGYPASSLPTEFQPTNIGYLKMKCGRQKQLWQGNKVLPNLKILDLSWSNYLMNTPDFNGLPCLERLILKHCVQLKKIHPSIGYHKRLVHLNMEQCEALKTFPPIKGMPELETLDLSWCLKLEKFPDIETSMDSLVNLDLSWTGIRIIPASVGQFCTNLVSFDLSSCHKLKRIECNFHLLKSLQVLNLQWCEDLSTSLTKKFTKRIGLLQDNSMSLKFLQFPCFFRKLNLSRCNLRDGDIPSDLSGLLNLHVLDLRGNNFSRLHSSLSRIPCLKSLDLSGCKRLVELPDLPSSIAILKAKGCMSLKSVGDLSKYKWLWKVTFDELHKLIGGKRAVIHSLLQVNALEDRFMSVKLIHAQSKPKDKITTPSFTLQLPHNWYSDFSGFLFCIDSLDMTRYARIVIKQQEEMSSTDSQPAQDHWEEFDKNLESYEQVGYVPFASLSHIHWWNNSKKISIEMHGVVNPKVGLVPRKSKSVQSSERAIEFWDEEYKEYRKTFEIIDDSKFYGINIEWHHEHD